MAKKAIKCSKMFDSTTSTVKENVVIFTEGDKITAVVPMAEAKYEDCEVIDLTGKFVTPGPVRLPHASGLQRRGAARWAPPPTRPPVTPPFTRSTMSRQI